MTLRILSLAEADLLNGFRFYERQSVGVGWYFLESLSSDIESLRLYGGTHRRVFSYHRLLSKRFPFAIYYDLNKDEIRVLARVGLPTRSALARASVNKRSQTMNIEEIKDAVKDLSRRDLGVFRKWFWEFDQEKWDQEIQEDVKAGGFDSILRQVDRDTHKS